MTMSFLRDGEIIGVWESDSEGRMPGGLGARRRRTNKRVVRPTADVRFVKTDSSGHLLIIFRLL